MFGNINNLPLQGMVLESYQEIPRIWTQSQSGLLSGIHSFASSQRKCKKTDRYCSRMLGTAVPVYDVNG